jgi:hypothetical protein
MKIAELFANNWLCPRGQKKLAHPTGLNNKAARVAPALRSLFLFFVFDFHPLLTLPIVQNRKWIKKVLLFEPKASFKAFPFFVLHNWEPEGQWQRGRLSLLTFFDEAKKVIRWTTVQPIGTHAT